jgi:3-oxoacyl-[acyl-carrier protein] reductase
MPLTDRIAIVTGAGGGLGRVVAADLAGAGARLALVGSHQAHVDALGRDLAIGEDRWFGVAADLRDPAAAERMVAAVVERFGRVDILAHLVGGYSGGTPLTEVAADDIQAMLDQHLWTTFNVTRAVVPHLVAAGFGRIVAISTPVAAETPPKMVPYAVGKAALEALFGTLAREVAGTGVTANLLRVRKIDVEHARDAAEPPKGAGTWTTPEEISAAIRYLCSDEAGSVNGARIPLYGSA